MGAHGYSDVWPLNDAMSLTNPCHSQPTVQRINAADSIISSVAGTGTFGYTADNVAALTSQLNTPTWLALRGKVLFISDTGARSGV